MKLYIHEDYLDIFAEDAKQLGFTLTTQKEAEVIICQVSQIEDLNQLHNLRIIQLLSAGYNGLDLETLRKNSIHLLNARGVYSEEIAEYILAHVLSVYKSVIEMHTNQNQKVWDRTLPMDSLVNKTILYLGTGSIAQETARRFNSFGVTNIGLNTTGHNIDGFDKTDALTNLDKYISDVDIIIAALPENDTTRHLLNGTSFSKMKAGMVFVNVGRGSLIDEQSLKGHIKHLKALILDVFEAEPLDENHFLWNEENVLITPHISFKSKLNDQKRQRLIIENLKRIKNNEDLINVII